MWDHFPPLCTGFFSFLASFFNFFDLGIGGGSLILGVVASVFSYTVVYAIAIGIFVVYILLYLVYSQKQQRYTARQLEVDIE
ncbi:hypothetical protein [Paenibacillus sp. FSL R5-0519]|uniref:hypothetical protein n=1 Tax=Paenibacillus sp. FSL R5-0519 TaxID=2921648 RepID=UPI0030DD5789